MRNIFLSLLVIMIAFQVTSVIDFSSNPSEVDEYVFVSEESESESQIILSSSTKKISSSIAKRVISSVYKLNLVILQTYSPNVVSSFWIGFFNDGKIFFSPQMYQSNYLS